jgi:hypothetical protein
MSEQNTPPEKQGEAGINQFTFYISTEQAFRKVINAIENATDKHAFSKKSRRYKKTAHLLESMLKELIKIGEINTED